MFSKLRTLAVVCSVAVLAISAVSLACDKDKQIAAKSSCGSQKTASIVQVADGTKHCSKSKQVATVAAADKTAGCAKSAATKETMALLAKAISAMKADDARTNVIAAYRTLAVANPDLTCEKQASAVKAVALGSGSGNCASKAKATQVANKQCDPADCAAKIASGECNPADCKAAKAKAMQVSNKQCDPADCAAKIASGECNPADCKAAKARATTVANTKACDPAACKTAKATTVANTQACDPAACKAAKATKVASGQSACSKSQQAGYVAFGCQKTDKIARTAAGGYLQIMRELKAYSGADGCAASTASKLLAQMLEEQSAQASVVEVDVETVANVETVSLGAVSETKTKSSCSSKK